MVQGRVCAGDGQGAGCQEGLCGRLADGGRLPGSHRCWAGRKDQLRTMRNEDKKIGWAWDPSRLRCRERAGPSVTGPAPWTDSFRQCEATGKKGEEERLTRMREAESTNDTKRQ